MAVKDLVSGVLAESITTSTTNVLVTIAQSIGRPGILAFFPTPPFYITIMPKSPAVGVANRLDSEILQVTAVGNDQVGNAALTCVRGQRDTTAKAFSAGDIVTVGVYTDDAVLLGGTGTTETATPWIDRGDIKTDAFALPVLIARVGFNKRTYSNGYMYLENLNVLYAANGVSASLANGNLRVALTLPTSGSYVADVQSNLWVNNNTWDYMWLKNQKYDGSTYVQISDAMGPKAGSWAFVTTRGCIGISNGESLCAYLATNGNNYSDGNMSNNNSFMEIIVYKVG